MRERGKGRGGPGKKARIEAIGFVLFSLLRRRRGENKMTQEERRSSGGKSVLLLTCPSGHGKRNRERESEREESESERAIESEGREPDVRLLAFSALFSTIDHRDERQKRLSPVPFPSPIFSSLSSAVRLHNLMLLPKLKEEEDRELKSQGTVFFFLFLYGREREEREERASLLFSSSLVFLFY